ncbi:Mis12 domain-containing protein [Bimuria novae-zelandiae CBS 107.79]|uniref:Mis12 domain-containing protein n=1 Tax=Bimuria novae-zelandiae CBS 107.79 TaxID=1447943 RepID=A0A6A5W3G7_9PLEO|nr:Mis12 domain-containing protein [Bimuria novae-zelandiae CBS 107.79]
MASSKQNENLLLTEHFTWPPISLLDEIINAVNESLNSCNDTLEMGLLSVPPEHLGFTPGKDESAEKMGERARLEIEEGAQKLETLMMDAVDRNFDRLEIWTLRNVLCLPREEGFEGWVRLGHYEGLRIPPKDNTITPEALYALRRKLVETNRLREVLEREQRRNEEQLTHLRRILQPVKREPRSSTSSEQDTSAAQDAAPFAFLTHNPSAQALGVQPLPAQKKPTSAAAATALDSRTPLATHTSFTISQLPFLREQLAELKSKLGSAALPRGKGGDGEERVNERRTYIESQSRRILEKRGVDTKDGVEGNFEGQRARGEEIGALEGIVSAIGRGRSEAAAGVEGEGEGDVMDTS